MTLLQTKATLAVFDSFSIKLDKVNTEQVFTSVGFCYIAPTEQDSVVEMRGGMKNQLVDSVACNGTVFLFIT